MTKKLNIKTYLEKRLEGQTVKAYLYVINNFLIQHPKAKSYKYQDLVSYMASVRKQYENTQTCIRILSAVKKYYDYLMFIERRTDHPCQTITLKKKWQQRHSVTGFVYQ